MPFKKGQDEAEAAIYSTIIADAVTNHMNTSKKKRSSVLLSTLTAAAFKPQAATKPDEPAVLAQEVATVNPQAKPAQDIATGLDI